MFIFTVGSSLLDQLLHEKNSARFRRPPPRRINRTAAMTTILLRCFCGGSCCFCGGSYSATYRFGICTGAFPAFGCKRSRLVELDTIRCLFRGDGRFFAVAFAFLRCVLPFSSSWSRGQSLQKVECSARFPAWCQGAPVLFVFKLGFMGRLSSNCYANEPHCKDRRIHKHQH